MNTKRRLLLPDEIELRASRLTDGRVEFSYTERALDDDILHRTATLLAPLTTPEGIAVEHGEHSVTLRGTIPRRQFGDMMTGEFMLWSHLADITVGEMMAVLVHRTLDPAPTVPSPDMELHRQISEGTRTTLLGIIDDMAVCLPTERLEAATLDRVNELLRQARMFESPEEQQRRSTVPVAESVPSFTEPRATP